MPQPFFGSVRRRIVVLGGADVEAGGSVSVLLSWSCAMVRSGIAGLALRGGARGGRKRRERCGWWN